MRCPAVVVAVSLTATGYAVPASAEYTCVGFNTGGIGEIYCVSDQDGDPRGPAGTYRIAAQCGFAAVLTPANTLIVNYAGTATAVGPVGDPDPLLTAVDCKIKNASGNSQHKDISLNGAASATADSTLLATSGPKEWPVEDVTICVSAFGVWGPTPVRIVTLGEYCQTS